MSSNGGFPHFSFSPTQKDGSPAELHFTEFPEGFFQNHQSPPDFSFPDVKFPDLPAEYLIPAAAWHLTVLAIMVFSGYFLYKNGAGIWRRVVSDIKDILGRPTALSPPSSPAGGMFPDFPLWQADAPTMERFFRELAQDRPVRFNPQQLNTLTKNYSTILGSGGYGKVYEGQLPNGLKIAVKVLNKGTERDARVEEQFMAEVGTIGRTNHFNLVRLYGFCYDQLLSALVYEFMENGSLDKHLFNNTRQLEWEKLHEIAVGTAKGIAYLHEECQQTIVHYDIKPGNVLLDADFTPKVADFGMAKICMRDATHVTISGYRGTPGYSAPEFMLRNFPITYKCDVYSFGMLLFEIVGRRRNAEANNGGGEEDSLYWFPKQVWGAYEKGELMGLLGDREIEEKYREEAKRMAMVALWCAQDSPEHRPHMSAVVKMLEGGVEIMPPPKPFHYLSAVGPNLWGQSSSNSESGSRYSTCEPKNLTWYKETTTPVMHKYEINLVTL